MRSHILCSKIHILGLIRIKCAGWTSLACTVINSFRPVHLILITSCITTPHLLHSKREIFLSAGQTVLTLLLPFLPIFFPHLPTYRTYLSPISFYVAFFIYPSHFLPSLLYSPSKLNICLSKFTEDVNINLTYSSTPTGVVPELGSLEMYFWSSCTGVLVGHHYFETELANNWSIAGPHTKALTFEHL
jgi:hypothetical protein